jgi:hypothetical protein
MAEREREEGWYTDPFGRHEARWMSDAAPTQLVRDVGVESYDEPKDEEASVIPTPIAEEQMDDGRDLLRADDPDPGGGSLSERMSEGAEFGASTVGSDLLGADRREEE